MTGTSASAFSAVFAATNTSRWDNTVGLVLAALAVIYLILVLVFPERF